LNQSLEDSKSRLNLILNSLTVARPCRGFTGFLTLQACHSKMCRRKVKQCLKWISMKNELILLCHAATHAMKSGLFPSIDDALDEPEPARIPRLASIYQPERVITSPVRAAIETGRAFAIKSSIDPVWRDLDYGRWQGRPIRDIHDEDADGLGAWLSEPASAAHGGESLEALQARVRGALDTHREARVTLVVTHAIVVKAVLATVLSAPLAALYRMDLEPLSAITLTYSGDTWRLRCKAFT
jgi:broad specificity phosphatase PhoE